ncbi:hypothetical protein QNJ28_10570 [Macrococcus caseolyticus]|uniref:hypothetical protein n=1 Tax=Macrococcoides caseolyticum TaxID=69966 RepID=UPI0024BC9784|nr:hypothetical protein [Macrococcus caseolyticus]MDJ1110500.1 hypothetical protein [Macrococcus caseolyticus]
MNIIIETSEVFSLFKNIPYKYFEKYESKYLYYLLHNVKKGKSLYPLDDPGTPNYIFLLRIRNELLNFFEKVYIDFNKKIYIQSHVKIVDPYTLWILSSLKITIHFDKKLIQNKIGIYSDDQYPLNQLKLCLKNGFFYDIANYYLKSYSMRVKNIEYSNLFLAHYYYAFKKYKLSLYRYKMGLNSPIEYIKIMSFIGIINTHIKLKNINIAEKFLNDFEKYINESNKDNLEYKIWIINLKSYLMILIGKYKESYMLLLSAENYIDSEINNKILVLKKNKYKIENSLGIINDKEYLEKIKSIIQIRPYDDDLKVEYQNKYFSIKNSLDKNISLYHYHEEINYRKFISSIEEREEKEIFDYMMHQNKLLFHDSILIRYLTFIISNKLLKKEKIISVLCDYLQYHDITPLIIKFTYIYLRDTENVKKIFDRVNKYKMTKDLAFYYILFYKESFFNVNLEKFDLTQEQKKYLRGIKNE